MRTKKANPTSKRQRLGRLDLVNGEYKGRKFYPNHFVYVDTPVESDHTYDSLVDVLRHNVRFFGSHSKIVDLDTNQILWESENEYEVLQVVGFNDYTLVRVICQLGEFQTSLTQTHFCEMFGDDAALLWSEFSEKYKYNFLTFYGSLNIDKKQDASKYIAHTAHNSPYRMLTIGVEKNKEGNAKILEDRRINI